MSTPKFKANDFVKIVNTSPNFEFLDDANVLVPDESLIGLVGVVRATFNYDTQANDYDVAIIGRKYKSHHQHIALDEQFLEAFPSVYEGVEAA